MQECGVSVLLHITVWSRESTRPLFEIYVCAEKGVAFRPCIHYRTSFSMPRTSKGSRTSTSMGCRYNLSFIHSRSSCSSSSSSSRGSTIFKSSMTSGSLTVIVFFLDYVSDVQLYTVFWFERS